MTADGFACDGASPALAGSTALEVGADESRTIGELNMETQGVPTTRGLDGWTAVVTGAASGLGETMATTFAREGHPTPRAAS